MSNFTINFEYPWLLFLIIPALAVTLIPYFRVPKRYRRTRNRITSIVLHAVVIVTSILVLSGISFSYDLANKNNEVLLLVDSSFSGQEIENNKNNYIKSVIDESDSRFKIGIVTFGYNQVYAAELTNDTDKIYNQYLAAERPDDSATDIASALSYARTLFESPQTAKIVLISDGLETDGSAKSIIKSIAAEGIKVDTVSFSALHADEVQLIDVVLPDYNVAVGDECNISLSLQSSYTGAATVTVYDNDVAGDSVSVDLSAGVQTLDFTHTFTLPGLHEISFSVESRGDSLNENNTYFSYLYLETFDNILIIERNESESDRLKALLDDEYNVTVVNISDTDELPATADELRQYDQVILVNIANADMPVGFIEELHTYVYSIGGGLFTVGGNKIENGEEVANSYNRSDLYGTLYQDMLPVQAINYTPPIALMIIIDRSGSMGTSVSLGGGMNKTRLELAQEGALSCLNALSERDYCGVMSLESSYSEEIAVTPMTQQSKIISAIDNLEPGGGTVYSGALERAGSALNAVSNVQIKHILLVTDGEPGDPATQYQEVIKRNYDTSGITMSIISVGTSSNADAMQSAAECGHGNYIAVSDVTTLPGVMREELNIKIIEESNMETFTPKIGDYTSVVNGIKQEDMPTLDGFYGTKIKSGADAPLIADYVPIYAQWNYGAGTVGSFMCDLNGTWSSNFISNSTGIRFINNVIKAIFPKQDIREHEIDAVLKEENYTTQMSIYTTLEEEQTLQVTITSPPGENGESLVQTIIPGESELYSRVTFTITQPGVHTILIEKKDASGNVIAQYTTYKSFSYSAEYNMFADADAGILLLEELSVSGNGTSITDVSQIFKDVTESIHKVSDPRLPLIIIAIVLFLLDIAVRKFKFKWPHEIIRDRKNARLTQQGKNS